MTASACPSDVAAVKSPNPVVVGTVKLKYTRSVTRGAVGSLREVRVVVHVGDKADHARKQEPDQQVDGQCPGHRLLGDDARANQAQQARHQAERDGRVQQHDQHERHP
jgi:hypothetical protein